MLTSSGLRRRMTHRLPNVDGVVDATWFVTICSHQRAKMFGRVSDSRVELSEIGQVVAQEWVRSAEIRPEVRLDEWIVMPNHLHAVVQVPRAGVPAALRAALQRRPRTLGSLISGFKSAVTARVRILLGDPEFRVWQPGYYDHGIRTERALENICDYIHDNPARWDTDPENV